jgi:hypothetical protein
MSSNSLKLNCLIHRIHIGLNVNIFNNDFKSLLNALNEYFHCNKDTIPKKESNYYRMKEYKNASISLLYNPKKKYFPYCLLIIHDLTLDKIELIESITNCFPSCSSTIGYIELTVDFCTYNTKEFYTFTKEHLYLKYYRKLKKYKNFCNENNKSTFYIGDCHSQSQAKATRLYIKEEENKVRLELVLKRSLIRRLGFNLSSLYELKPKILTEYISFKSLPRKYKNTSKTLMEIIQKKRKLKKRVSLRNHEFNDYFTNALNSKEFFK